MASSTRSPSQARSGTTRYDDRLFRLNHINPLVCIVVRGIFVLLFNDDLMRLFVRLTLLFSFIGLLAACQRPTAYFQRTPHTPAARLPLEQPTLAAETQSDSIGNERYSVNDPVEINEPVIASLKNQPVANPNQARVERRMHRIQSLLTAPTSSVDKQPRPKPKSKQNLRLGNRIRSELGIPLRKELNWWQKISWKLKASVIVILVAVVFAIANITILAIIFGVLGAFLLITGLKKSMKVRRPWF
jgi:hypothetical protein